MDHHLRWRGGGVSGVGGGGQRLYGGGTRRGPQEQFVFFWGGGAGLQCPCHGPKTLESPVEMCAGTLGVRGRGPLHRRTTRPSNRTTSPPPAPPLGGSTGVVPRGKPGSPVHCGSPPPPPQGLGTVMHPTPPTPRPPPHAPPSGNRSFSFPCSAAPRLPPPNGSAAADVGGGRGPLIDRPSVPSPIQTSTKSLPHAHTPRGIGGDGAVAGALKREGGRCRGGRHGEGGGGASGEKAE